MSGAKKQLKRTVKDVSKGAKKVTKLPTTVLGAQVGALTSAIQAEKQKKATNPTVSTQIANNQLSAIEKRAGVTPPQYESLRDPLTGQLKSDFTYDPTKSGAFSELQKQAMAAPGESPWAKMQMQKQALEEQGLMDQTATAGAAGLAQAQSQLMRQGGLGSGARTRIASQGAKDMMLAQQQARRAGISDRLGIGESDINRQADLLGRVSGTELEGQGRNLQSTLGDVQGKQGFDMERYAQQMGAYGAEQTARGQERAAKQANKGSGLLGGKIIKGIL